MKEIAMTDIDNIPLQPEPPLREPAPKLQRDRRLIWPRAFALAGVLTFGVALGAGGLAFAAGMEHMGWRHGPHLAMIQGFVQHTLDSVGATSEQEAKVHDIIAAKFTEIAPNPEEHQAMRKQALELLAAPTIDRAAVEKLRADVVAKFDAKSKAIVSGVLDIADQLTPAQRAALTTQLQEMAEHGPMGMGGMDGWRHHQMMDGQDGPHEGGDDKN
jgi:periplasmic protein CpxP/Spy